jgi:hypothetical protein
LSRAFSRCFSGRPYRLQESARKLAAAGGMHATSEVNIHDQGVFSPPWTRSLLSPGKPSAPSSWTSTSAVSSLAREREFLDPIGLTVQDPRRRAVGDALRGSEVRFPDQKPGGQSPGFGRGNKQAFVDSSFRTCSIIDSRNGQTITYSCQYHVAWCRKHRGRVWVNGVDERLKMIIRDVASTASRDHREWK